LDYKLWLSFRQVRHFREAIGEHQADEEFGMTRVRAVLATHARAPLATIELELLDAARAHGTPHDDQSLILIRRLP
jgi:hypothetical protein